ncbi:Ribonuclease P protein subunit p40 [Phytophthora citrophthora]|uniref:Ribonuclease P protein subunit p40 n=1 Tax=Phytophthora citrophthora TaxID=4793 RepID=A0AAD9LSJ4_9STRA|nr:Ribonuclease P protein subunit p40 [Phytophthora citrophthora]
MVSGGKAARRNAAQRRGRLQGTSALLQSSPDTAYPSPRLLVWHSRFSHSASRHESIINGHAFNQQLEAYLPSKAGKATAQSLQWETGFYYEVKASVDMFLSSTFIREYLSDGGTVFMVAKNATVDASQSAMLLPSGQLLLLVDVDTYQQLGIVGEKYGKAVPAASRSAHSKRAQKYVITLDLTSPTFTEAENAFRDRVRLCLNTKFEDLEMLLCAYNERGSARTILFGDDDQIPRSRVELNAKMTTFTDVFLPKFDAFYKQLAVNEEHGEEEGDLLRASLQEAYDWLGMVACGLPDLLQRKKQEEYVSTFTGIPDSFESEPDSEITTVRWRGLIAAPFCSAIVSKVQRAVKSGEVPWGAVTVWGFPDTFVSWVQPKANKSRNGTNKSFRREHGYVGNGSNNYTLIILPDDEYFLLQALGPHDATV